MILNPAQPSPGTSKTIGISQMETPGAREVDRNMIPGILVLADWYLPGSKAGGTVSAIANMIELVGDEFRFRVLTRNRDLNERSAYAGVQTDRWIPVGKARVLYASSLSFSKLRGHILDAAPDLIYLTSFFSPWTRKILLLRRLGLLPASAVVLAPQGEFSAGALSLKRVRKWLYQRVTNGAGLYRDLTWHACSNLEEQQITAAGIANGARNRGRFVVTPNVPSPRSAELPVESQRRAKRPGAVRLIFLSRISRMKNLLFVLRSLASVRDQVELAIVGPAEDAAYWAACQRQIRTLPKNVVVSCAGTVRHELVRRAYLQHHFLILPTLGENFGYAILEALAAGCPVLISDQTPWRDLRAAGVGWDLPLSRTDLWQDALQECIAMDEASFHSMSHRARCFAERWVSFPFFHRDKVNLFRGALDSAASQ
jgi:glycosyltransferase involved in cell wall biosynthesis